MSNIVCHVASGSCKDTFASSYYKDEKGKLLPKRHFVMPAIKTWSRPMVHCLNRTSNYFDNDDEVNQAPRRSGRAFKERVLVISLG